MKRLNVSLTDEQHKALKSELAKRGMSITEWVRRNLQALLRDNERSL